MRPTELGMVHPSEVDVLHPPEIGILDPGVTCLLVLLSLGM